MAPIKITLSDRVRALPQELIDEIEKYVVPAKPGISRFSTRHDHNDWRKSSIIYRWGSRSRLLVSRSFRRRYIESAFDGATFFFDNVDTLHWWVAKMLGLFGPTLRGLLLQVSEIYIVPQSKPADRNARKILDDHFGPLVSAKVACRSYMWHDVENMVRRQKLYLESDDYGEWRP